MDNGASSYRHFLDGDESAFETIMKELFRGLVFFADLFLTYTDVSDILLISSQLCSYGTRAPSTEVAPGDVTAEAREDNKDLESNVSDSFTDSANIGFTITLVLHGGEKTEFYLTGNTLKNLPTKQKYTLSQKEGNELKDLLGISHS